jgi:AtzE family amidohydrolase
MSIAERALDVAGRVARGEVRAREVVEATLARLPSLDDRFNCFTAVTTERALAEADAIDARRDKGERLGPLAGVPFAVKNLFDVKGLPTLAGSRINADLAPAARDAFAVRRMTAAGAVLVGALNMEEYAYGFTTENSHYGPTRNPHDSSRITGGSSGGSAAAVAAGIVPLTLGSDTNGSIRVPASLCGIFGVKPTYGRLSRAGTFPFVSSFDHVGPFARSVSDLAAVYDALLGYDEEDPVCMPREQQAVSQTLSQGIGDLRIGVAAGAHYEDYLLPGVREAVDAVCECLNAKTRIEMPDPARARFASFIITSAESSNLHFPALKTRPADFDPLTRERLLAGALLPAHWVTQAQRFRRWYRDQVLALFERTDIIIAASTAFTATPIGQNMVKLNGQEMPLRPSLGLLTQPISFVGLPVVSVPVGSADGMPSGIQIIAAPWKEADAFRVAAYLEKAGLAHAPVPPLLNPSRGSAHA